MMMQPAGRGIPARTFWREWLPGQPPLRGLLLLCAQSYFYFVIPYSALSSALSNLNLLLHLHNLFYHSQCRATTDTTIRFPRNRLNIKDQAAVDRL